MKGSPEAGRRSPLRLRAAVERLLAERAAAKAAAPRSPTATGRKVPAALHRRRRLSHLTLTLRDPRLPAGELPTAQLLDAALAVLTQGHHRPGDWRLEGWFFGVALRAVCEAILEDGRLTLPIAVVLETHPHKETWPPKPPIPQLAFSRVDERQAGEPLRLRIRRGTEPCCPREAPLPELLDAALNVLASGYHRAGRWRQERWFLRQGLLAVCEAVLTSDTGHLPLPLRVRLYRRDNLAARTALPARVRALARAFPSINPPPGR